MRSRSARRTRLSSTDRSGKMSSFNAARQASSSRKIFCVFLVGTTVCDRRSFYDGDRSTQPPRHAVHELPSSRAVRSLITRPGNRPHGRLPSTTVASDRAHGFHRRSAAGCAGRPDGSSCRSTHPRMQSSFDSKGLLVVAKLHQTPLEIEMLA